MRAIGPSALLVVRTPHGIAGGADGGIGFGGAVELAFSYQGPLTGRRVEDGPGALTGPDPVDVLALHRPERELVGALSGGNADDDPRRRMRRSPTAGCGGQRGEHVCRAGSPFLYRGTRVVVAMAAEVVDEGISVVTVVETVDEVVDDDAEGAETSVLVPHATGINKSAPLTRVAWTNRRIV